MRYLILVLAALSLTGCGPQQTAKADDKPVATKESYTAAVHRFDASLATVSENVGNYNSELNAVKEELKALKLTLDSLEGLVGDVHKLLTVDTEISLPVPGPPAEPTLAPPPGKPDAIAYPTGKPGEYEAELIYKPSMTIEIAAPQQMKFQGKVIDVHEWLKRKVKLVEIKGDVDKHLRDHGLDGNFGELTRAQKIQLHSVAHTYGIPLKSTSPRKVVVKAPAVVLPYSSNCANGNCQRYGYSRSRSRLFGWR